MTAQAIFNVITGTILFIEIMFVLWIVAWARECKKAEEKNDRCKKV